MNEFRTSCPYQYGIITVKKYGNSYKITYHNVLKESGWEKEDIEDSSDSPEASPLDDFKLCDNFKLLNNISRAKNTIFELAKCNDWDFFVTLTIDKSKHDRFNLQEFRVAFSRMVRGLRRKYGSKIAYLLVPEKHKNGAWHFHGFISGLPDHELKSFKLCDKLPSYIRQKVMLNQGIYSWISYAEKFGFCDLEEIQDKSKVCSYVTKYITKALVHSVEGYYENLYYCSQGLKRAEQLGKFYPLEDVETFVPWQFENYFCKILWVPDLPEHIKKRLECSGEGVTEAAAVQERN